MMQHHNYSLTELENMMPWEREIYIGLLMEYIKEDELDKLFDLSKILININKVYERLGI